MKKIIFGDSSFRLKCEGRIFLRNCYTAGHSLHVDYKKACTTEGIVDLVYWLKGSFQIRRLFPKAKGFFRPYRLTETQKAAYNS